MTNHNTVYAFRASVAEEGEGEGASFVYILAQRPYTFCVFIWESYPKFTILSVYNIGNCPCLETEQHSSILPFFIVDPE